MKIYLQIIFMMAFLPSFSFAVDMKMASNYVVRNLNGEEVCKLTKDTVISLSGIAEDGERVRIQAASGPCAGVTNGFVYVNYLRPVSNKVDATTEIASVATAGLSLRTSPSVEEGTFKCSLPLKTKVNILQEAQKQSRWVEVELANPPKGCPQKGWVSAAHLKPDMNLENLPKATDQTKTEALAIEDCADCKVNEVSGGKKDIVKGTADAAADINKFVNKPDVAAAVIGAPHPFSDFALQLQATKKCPKGSTEYKCNRGLMQMPVDGNAGFCSTHHYTPGKPPGGDAYAAPQTACSLIALTQKWKKGHCPDDNAGCRIAWGDISHVSKPIFNGHKAHTRGECIDIRPFNTGSFRDAGRTYTSSDYDRAKTIEFLKLVKQFGGDIMYSDRKILKDAQLQKELNVQNGGAAHNNHIHICFEATNEIAASACKNLTVDPKICSELQ